MILLIFAIVCFSVALFLLLGFRTEKISGLLLIVAGILGMLSGADRRWLAFALMVTMFLYLIPFGRRRRRRRR